MKITVRLFAGLRERAGADELVLAALPDAMTLADLKRRLEAERPELGALGPVRGVVGTDYVPDGTALADGDVVALLPPVSGGAPDDHDSDADLDARLARGVFAIRTTALDPGACQRRVEHPSCGAVVVFTGLTRDTNRGQDVARLDYEAFEEMAGAEMARIFERCRAEHPSAVLRLLVEHRTGTVGVGEPSVVVAVASPHRDAAFSAARFLIDALKASVPLWKKEVYADGHHWINDRS